MLSGWHYQDTVNIKYSGAHPANKTMFFDVGPNHPIWGASNPDGSDWRVTKADGTTLCNYSFDRFIFRSIARMRIRIPNDTSATSLLLQWGNTGASAVSNSQNTLDIPKSTERGSIGVWTTFADTTGPYVDSTGITGSLTKSGTIGGTRSISDLGWGRQYRLRIGQFAGNMPDAIAFSGSNSGVQFGGSGAMQTPAIAMPAAFTLKLWLLQAGTGYIASWYGDSNNNWFIQCNGSNGLTFTRKVGGVTSTFTTNNVFNSTIEHIAIVCGPTGFQVFIQGIRYYFDPTSTAAYSNALTAKITFGGLDTGSGPGSLASVAFIMVPTFHNVELTAWEINCGVFLMQPYDNITQLDGIQNGLAVQGKWAKPITCIDGTATAERAGLSGTQGMAQESTILPGLTNGKFNGTWHMFYDAGLNHHTICHATSADRIHWTRDAANPVITDAANTGDTVACGGYAMGDGFMMVWVNDFTNYPYRCSFSTDGGETWTTPITLLNNLKNSTWGNNGFGNHFIYQAGTQVQMDIEASGVGGVSFQMGTATGPNMFSMALPTQATDGGSLKGSPAQSAELSYVSQTQNARTLASTGNLTITASTATLTRASGSFSGDGVAVLDTISIKGFTNSGNNGQFVVATVGTTTLTFKGGTQLVNETAAATVVASMAPDFKTGQILGGPWSWTSPDGSTYKWGHGDIAGSPAPSAAYSINYMARTWDGVNYLHGPGDIVMFVRPDLIWAADGTPLMGADQVADPYIEYTGGNPILYCEDYDNANNKAMVIAAVASVATMGQLVVDSTRLESGLTFSSTTGAADSGKRGNPFTNASTGGVISDV